MPAWSYDPASRRYRHGETGRFLSAASQRDIHTNFMERLGQQAGDAAGAVADGALSVQDWEKRMQLVVRQAHGQSFALARGGWGQVSQEDAQALSAVVSAQYGYLHDFAQDLKDGALSAAQIAARSSLYVNAATASYARGQAAAHGSPPLSQYPGDGNSACLSNCRCSLAIATTDDGWEVTWRIDGGEHCEDCLDLARRWDPLVLRATAPVAA